MSRSVVRAGVLVEVYSVVKHVRYDDGAVGKRVEVECEVSRYLGVLHDDIGWVVMASLIIVGGW